MGPKTATAIKEYQRDQGLLVDGTPSAALLEHMRSK
jgi:peptidoglycan hydrolase-like protein with peptidoglycan-binding domain